MEHFTRHLVLLTFGRAGCNTVDDYISDGLDVLESSILKVRLMKIRFQL